jgi:DNA-binding HxlR family transcriptional regulator
MTSALDSPYDRTQGDADVDPPIILAGKLADRDTWQAEHCPIVAALEVLGTRSAFVILREAFYGATRFEQFVSRTQLSEPVTAIKLKELTEAGLLTKEPYRIPRQRTRNAYRLTQKGVELLPVLAALFSWGTYWQVADRQQVELAHVDCGGLVTPVLQCEHGHTVDAGTVELRSKREQRTNVGGN